MEPKVNRTCEGCRRRKIKCVRDAENSPSEKCERCTKLDLDCVFSAPAVRRKRRRNEAHIRQLEERLDQVWRLVSSEKGTTPWTGPATDAGTSSFTTPRSFDESPHLGVGSSPGGGDGDDPVASGLVDESLAGELCVEFCAKALPYYPLVFVPKPREWQSLRRDRPALFRAILAASSSCFRPEYSDALYRVAEKYVTEQAVLLGQKSIDLIQAALILAVWSRAPARFKDLAFGQFANISASMVTDLRSRNDRQYQLRGSEAAESRLEIARTFAAAYFLCSSIAMSYRRPTTLRYGSWVQTCIELLTSSTVATVADRRLAEWTRLQRLAEEGLNMAGLEEEEAAPNAVDDRSSAILGASQDQVRRWGQQLPRDIMSATVAIHYHVVLLNLNVPGLQQVHDGQDFRPPFALRTPSGKPPAIDPSQPGPSVRFIDARVRCLGLAKNIIDLFLTFSVEELQRLPVIVFTRLVYAAVVTIKLVICKNPDSSPETDSDGSIWMFDSFNQAVNKLTQASENSRFSIPTTFSAALQRMINWCIDASPNVDSGSDPDVIEPLENLNISSSAPSVSATSAPPTADMFGESLLVSDGLFDAETTAQAMPLDLFTYSTGTASMDSNIQIAPYDGSMAMPWDNLLVDEYFHSTYFEAGNNGGT